MNPSLTRFGWIAVTIGFAAVVTVTDAVPFAAESYAEIAVTVTAPGEMAGAKIFARSARHRNCALGQM